MLRTPPNPFDPARAARIHEFLAEQGFHATGPLLDAVFGNSPFLGRLSVREHGALTEYLAHEAAPAGLWLRIERQVDRERARFSRPLPWQVASGVLALVAFGLLLAVLC